VDELTQSPLHRLRPLPCGAVQFEIDYPAFWAWHDQTRALAERCRANGAQGHTNLYVYSASPLGITGVSGSAPTTR
jgi:hypothetical protein